MRTTLSWSSGSAAVSSALSGTREVDTWGIGGPTFVVVYAVFFLVTVAAVCGLSRRASARFDVGPADLDLLDPYEVALLRRSRHHAATVALLSLVRSGALRVYQVTAIKKPRFWEPTVPTALVRSGAPCPEGAHPLEAVTYATVANVVEPTPAEVVGEAAKAPLLSTIERALVDRGVMYDDDAFARRRRTMLLAWVPLLGLGAVRMVAGMAGDKPVGLLALMVVGAGWGVWLTHKATRDHDDPLRRSNRVPRSVYRALDPGDDEALGAAAPGMFEVGAPSPDLVQLGLMGVALLGTRSLMDANPALAEALSLGRYSVSWSGSAWWGGGGGGGDGGGCGGGCGG